MNSNPNHNMHDRLNFSSPKITLFIYCRGSNITVMRNIDVEATKMLPNIQLQRFEHIKSLNKFY